MKLNEKYYRQCVTEPIEVQTVNDGTIVEIHIMNDNPFYESVINNNQFAIWSSDNKGDYKVILEKGYYKAVKELYSAKVNGMWVNFLDECDKARRSFYFKVITPMIIIYYAVVFLITFFVNNSNKNNENNPATMIAIVLSVLGMFFMMFFSKRILEAKMKKLNREVVQRIKKIIGSKNFEKLITTQRKYTKDFFKMNNDKPSDKVEVKEIENQLNENESNKE